MLNQRNIPKCTAKPPDDDRVICNWCQEKVLGKNYKRHCDRKKARDKQNGKESHTFFSYKIPGLQYFKFRRSPHVKNSEDDLAQTDMDVMQTEAYASSMQAEENKENTNLMQIETEEITANLQRKRMRQQNLFETIGKFQQLQTKVSEILKEIEDPTQHGYLEKIRATLRLMEKAEADVRAYREKKRRKLREIEDIFRRSELLCERNRNLEAQSRQHQDQLVVQEMNQLNQRPHMVNKDNLMNVEECHREKTKNILRSNPHYDISDDGKHLICRVCDDNWEKARLEGKEHRGKISVNRHLTNVAKRHTDSESHAKCVRASEAFEFHREYDEDLMSSTDRRKALMTDNIILVVYFIIKENLAMQKSEALYELLAMCEAAIGNQLHSRITAKAITLTIDDYQQSRLIEFFLTIDDFYAIADELTDVSGNKSCIVKIRAFEGMQLVELFLTMVESTGTSAKLRDKLMQQIHDDLKKYGGLHEKDALQTWRDKFRGVGSDRAAKMLLWGKLMGESIEAYHQFNCDNHITEGAYQKLQELNSQLEKVEQMVKYGFKSQVHSANRKTYLKTLADKWMRKYYTLKNVLDIKFVTYNYEACVALMKDYPMVIGLAKKLKNDSTVKPKKKAMMETLFRHMTDGRILLNFMAAINVLKIISDYQKWGQREKASAFERKIAINRLETKFKSLSSKVRVENHINEYFDCLNFATGEMSIGTGENALIQSISHLRSMTKRQLIARIVKRQQEMAAQFLNAKKTLHQNEDPPFLSDLSDLFDIRLWRMTAFESEESQDFEEELNAMREKLDKESSVAFYSDLHANDILTEFDDVARAIHAQMQLDDGVLAKARTEHHIIDQWTCMMNRCPSITEADFPNWIRLVKRSAAAPNAQTGTERANSKYALAKTKLQCFQSNEVTRARVRIQENGPPLSMFKPLPVRKLWLREGHKNAEKVKSMEKSVVLERRRKDDAKNYKSKIFL